MTPPSSQGRLSTLQAALVVARRDFHAVLFSRSFLAFLIGPLFMLAVSALASSVGQQVEQTAGRPRLGVLMAPADTAAMTGAARRIDRDLAGMLPDLVPVAPPARDPASPQTVLVAQHGAIDALLTGTPERPVLTGASGLVESLEGPVRLIAGAAREPSPRALPPVTLAPVTVPAGLDKVGRMRTAQLGQTVLFLLTMLLAGMVLSNLVEEKANKIIEILAAAVPMDAVFLGKLFAMLAVSFVGIAVWGIAAGSVLVIGGHSLADLPAPAVGWPLFLLLGVVYFAMAYLLLGAVFLTIGSMASTVREVQTLSMPVTMLQLLVFFFATYAVGAPHSWSARAAEVLPFSSPFTMLARAAMEPGLTPHLLALGWQGLWVALFVRFGAQLFRRRVMKSGPAGGGNGKPRAGLARLFGRT
ncbi:ABC transporter permease [Novosphingobium piscinae]|uniref:ABC transporter permease n=1 Tax=Novosphingobium piscinae TaxID=1507448 RepID=A0A7X1G094_9SPHN|nr:ABC transporter permease [Novosphingobium piscinae]MBC2670280.1 ABC transporter permease [Novosphingobium piscinae]